MNENIISLLSLSELRSYGFFIPSYQRGYRWKDVHVKDLLNDIDEFKSIQLPNDESGNQQTTFYCLQPVVVKAMSVSEIKYHKLDDKIKWVEVIDGQQRITTVLLILKYLNRSFRGGRRDDEFTIKYETRPQTEEFIESLVNINYPNIDNIDFYHISEAYKTTKDWFDSYETVQDKPLDADDFSSKFRHRTKVIWYQISNDSDPREVFTRLNMGKIPLTNSELIKAILLKSDNFNQHCGATKIIGIDPNQVDQRIMLSQINIASEWDRIEQMLQQDDFWHFLTSENLKGPKIEMIFDLMAPPPDKNNEDKYHTYRYFNHRINTNGKVEANNIWDEVKSWYNKFYDWYNDFDLYHLIGYLIITGTDLRELNERSNILYKNDFKHDFLNGKIKDTIVNYKLEELDYDNNNKEIERVLLLFNIQTILDNHSYVRFPFNKFKEEKWSIEHIHAQNSDGLSKHDQFKDWLLDHKRILAKIFPDINNNIQILDIIAEIDGQLSLKRIERENFENVFKKVLVVVSREEYDTPEISNLTLLDQKSNSSLNKSIFAVKREKIIEREKHQVFVPICTRNIFLKYYTKNPNSLVFWDSNDRQDYYNSISKILDKYLN